MAARPLLSLPADGMGLDARAVRRGDPRRRIASANEIRLLDVPPLPFHVLRTRNLGQLRPASKKPEVDWLAQAHPDLAAIAIAMERLAHERGLTTTRGLGRRWSWSEYLGQGDPAATLQ